MLGRHKRIARSSSRNQNRRPRLETLEHRELLTGFTVTSAADSGPGSLRSAITAANLDNSPGADLIAFAIDSAGPFTIALQSPLPTITRPVNIDGSTQLVGGQPHLSPPSVVIDGSNLGAGADGLTLLGPGGSTIKTLAIVNFNSGTNGGGRGILVNDGGGDNFIGNYLGIDPNGNTAKGNVVGIELKSANNTVGTDANGTAPNLISGNISDGILIDGAGATGNRVIANRIGTDVSGQGSVGNLHGVTIASASNNSIGGPSAGSGNLISGNVGPNFLTGIGVDFTGTSSNNLVQGNLIGTDASGRTAVDNVYGIYFGTLGGPANGDSINGITIGGTITGMAAGSGTSTLGNGMISGLGNLISGNGIGIAGTVANSTISGNLIGTEISGNAAIGNGYGIFLAANTTTIGGTTPDARNVIVASGKIGSGGTGLDLTGVSDTVEGNFVGLGADGNTPLPNAVGMSLHLNGSTIGGTAPGAGNVVAGNTGNGIVLDLNAGNTIQGNAIGSPAGGPLGNGGNGISINLAPPTGSTPAPTLPLALDDTIGGLISGAANVIDGNAGAGIAVANTLGAYTGLSIRGNSIAGNGKLGIDLQGTGSPSPTFLAITSATSTASTSTISGVFGGTPGEVYQVDLYGNTVADASGSGQGQTYLGTASVTIGPGGIGGFSKALGVPLGPNPIVTATSTDGSGSTSEFSAAFPNNLGSADLAITQTASPPNVSNGAIVTFTATITNNGSATARNLLFNDALADSLINASVSTSVGNGYLTTGNVAQATLGDLAPGASATVTISANASANGTIGNLAGILGTTPDPNYANNFASQTFSVGPVIAPTADLAIAIAPSTSTPSVGSNLTYALTVTNNGASPATNVTVNDFLPSNATLVGATPSQGGAPTIRGTLITDNLGSIAAGASATITVIISPTASSTGSIVNSANVSGNQLDPIPGNNSATSTLPIAGSARASLSLTQTLNPTVGIPGQAETITLTVTNTGTTPATGVVLVDSIPGGVTLLSAAASQGSQPTFGNNAITSNLGTIAAGASATLTLSVVPKANPVGLVNSAAVVATGSSANTPVFSQATLNVAGGPSVNSVSGTRSNAQLVVNFNAAITQTSAANRANYLLYALGTTPRAITSADRPIAFTTAVYSASTNSATLTPSRSLDPTQYYALVVVGNTTTGITDTSGRKLVGVIGGAAGTNFSTTFLVGSLPQV